MGEIVAVLPVKNGCCCCNCCCCCQATRCKCSCCCCGVIIAIIPGRLELLLTAVVVIGKDEGSNAASTAGGAGQEGDDAVADVDDASWFFKRLIISRVVLDRCIISVNLRRVSRHCSSSGGEDADGPGFVSVARQPLTFCCNCCCCCCCRNNSNCCSCC